MSDAHMTKRERELFRRIYDIRTDTEEFTDLLSIYATKAEDPRETIHSIAKIARRMHMDLRQTTRLIDDNEMDMARSGLRPSTSDTQPCICCNDHYPVADEHVKGIQWEPIPGQGKAYMCWECCFVLYKILSRQLEGLAYTLIFSRSKETQALRAELPAVSEANDE